MTGSTPAIIIMIIVVMITLAAWIILVFYADAHPEWRRRAPSGHGHGQADGSPGRPTPGTQSPGRAARDTEASARLGGTREHLPRQRPGSMRAGQERTDSGQRHGSARVAFAYSLACVLAPPSLIPA